LVKDLEAFEEKF